MRNRAKCKKCESIIESFHKLDYVTCKCGEISVEGGQDCFKCQANDWENFLRVDDEGNEIIPKIVESHEEPRQELSPELSPKKSSEEARLPTPEDLLEWLAEMQKNIENLPPHAKSLPATQYDIEALIALLHMILKLMNNKSKF